MKQPILLKQAMFAASKILFIHLPGKTENLKIT